MADDYCELCELPLSTCVHGRPPPPPPAPAEKAPPRPRKSAARVAGTSRASTPERVVVRKWTPSADFRPHILEVLRDHPGPLDAEDLMLELEIRLEDVLRPGDRENAPEGGQRWHLGVRRERKALIDLGLLVPARPGVWELTAEGR